MNEPDKLPQSIGGALVSALFAILYWLLAHLGPIIGVLSAAAAIYSIRASRETIKLRRKQQDQLTSKPVQEPDADE